MARKENSNALLDYPDMPTFIVHFDTADPTGTINGQEFATTQSVTDSIIPIQTALQNEVTARENGDTQTIADAKTYSDGLDSATRTWATDTFEPKP